MEKWNVGENMNVYSFEEKDIQNSVENLVNEKSLKPIFERLSTK